MKTLKYSRQRESIKSCLMKRHDHPTADTLYTAIREEYPQISLGTVYRNLNLLVELGEIQKLTCGDGKDHFDGDTSPHYHFVCRCCSSVLDLPMKILPKVEHEAAEHLGAEIDSHSIYFYGTCHDCLQLRN
ncbi:MAG: Fur family transcriptional regulator [Lachnospiraceae bacterium]